MTERLYRSGREKMVGGVCGGLADYFHVDVSLVRIIALVSMIPGGIGFFVYILALIIIPVNPEHQAGSFARVQDVEPIEDMFSKVSEPKDRSDEHRRRTRLGGIILVVLGCLFLLDRWFPNFDISRMWPLILIVIGLAILWRGEHK